MPAIPFPVSSRPGVRPAESQGRLVNVFAEKDGDQVLWRRVAGLRYFCDTALTTPRGFLPVGATLYGAYLDRAVTIDAAGTVTQLTGALSGKRPVTWARNNKFPVPDIVAVTENGAFTVTSSAVSSFSDPDLPQPNSVSFLDGYFLFTIGDGQIFASDLNSTAINALSSAKAEAKPDGLTRGVVSGQLFYGFGPESIEVWQDVGTSPFPLGRVAVVPVGLAGPWAVAGDQNDWDLGLIFVAKGNTVRRMNGYQPDVVSIRDVERAIASVADKSTIEAYVYTDGGHAFWGISCPAWTWEYNVTTGEWHERRSYGLDRWRGSKTVNAFDKWLVGDLQSTRLQEITADSSREDQAPLVGTIESDAVKKFPANIVVRRTDFDFSVGHGVASGLDPIETDPKVMISWSDDGGATWGNPVMRSLGAQGQYRTRVGLTATGRATHHGRRWRLMISDPVHWSLFGGEMRADLRI